MTVCSEAELVKLFHYSCGAFVNGMRFSYPGSESVTHQILKETDESIQIQNLTDQEFPLDVLPHQLAINIITRWNKSEIISLLPHEVK